MSLNGKGEDFPEKTQSVRLLGFSTGKKRGIPHRGGGGGLASSGFVILPGGGKERRHSSKKGKEEGGGGRRDEMSCFYFLPRGMKSRDICFPFAYGKK